MGNTCLWRRTGVYNAMYLEDGSPMRAQLSHGKIEHVDTSAMPAKKRRRTEETKERVTAEMKKEIVKKRAVVKYTKHESLSIFLKGLPPEEHKWGHDIVWQATKWGTFWSKKHGHRMPVHTIRKQDMFGSYVDP